MQLRMANNERTQPIPKSRRLLRPDHNYNETDPHEIIGRTLKRARRSSRHPSVTLEFSDNTSFQILVDGYDPVHRGIPKELDMDPFIHTLCTNTPPANLTVTDCTLVTLSDKAYERRSGRDEVDELRWDQRHHTIAFKFSGNDPTWHSVSAIMEEYDPDTGSCIFRSYIDVYLKLKTNRPFRRKQRRRS